MIYKIKLTHGQGTEVVEGDWPNQRDAINFAKAHSVMANTGTPLNDIEATIIEPAALSWGGARPGAGRPRLADEPTTEATILLPASLDTKAQRIGDGNRSAGIRRALEAYREIAAPDEDDTLRMAGIDLDGTLLNYGGHTTGDVRVNHAFIAQLQADGVEAVAIISNQGGINFHDADPATYPSAALVARRIEVACAALESAGIKPASVDVAVFHPRADAGVVATNAATLRDEIASLPYPVGVWENAGSRKPATAMIELANIAVYYGDSDEDEAAAKAAGARFVRVARFQ